MNFIQNWLKFEKLNLLLNQPSVESLLTLSGKRKANSLHVSSYVFAVHADYARGQEPRWKP